MALVYRHRRLDTNEIFYIGIELDSVNKIKLGRRPYVKCNKSNFWKRITNKTKYSVEIIYDNLSNEDAIELEIFLISEYGRRDLNKGNLVNHTNGGEGIVGFKHSEETILKMKNSAKGRVISKEQRMKISNSNLGKKHTEESKLKISESKIGKKHSDEARLKMSMSAKGFSKECILNAALSNGKKVIDIETGEIFNSITDASKKSNYSLTSIRRFLNGKLKNKTNLIYLKDVN